MRRPRLGHLAKSAGGGIRAAACSPRLHVPVALAALAAVTLLVPLGTPGCSGPLVELLRPDQTLTGFVEPGRDLDELSSDTQAIVAAEAVVREKADAVAAAQEQQRQTEAARAAADDADSEARDLEFDSLVGGGDWSVSSAESRVSSAESRVESAESWVDTVEGMFPDDPAADSYTGQMLADAKEDLQSAQSELAKAKAALATARAEESSANRSQESARATADALAAEADAAESAARAALSSATEELETAEAAEADARRRKAQHANEYEAEVAAAYTEHVAASRAKTATNAVNKDCERNARPHLGAVGVLVAGAGGVIVTPLLARPWRRFRRHR